MELVACVRKVTCSQSDIITEDSRPLGPFCEYAEAANFCTMPQRGMPAEGGFHPEMGGPHAEIPHRSLLHRRRTERPAERQGVGTHTGHQERGKGGGWSSRVRLLVLG